MLTGAAAGGIIPVLSALLNQYTEPGEEGAAFGFDTSVASLARAGAPMIGTAIVLVGNFRFIFLFSSLLLALTAILAYWKLPEFQKSRA